VGSPERRLVAAHRRTEAGGIAGGQQGQVLRADLPGAGQDGGVGRFRQASQVGVAQLQQQAFGHVASADADRVERLQQGQRGAQFVDVRFRVGGQPAQDLFQRRSQVAVLVQLVDQQRRQHGVAGRGARQHQLPQQVLAQGIRARRFRGAGILIRIDPARTRHFIHRRLAFRCGLVVLHGRLAFGFGLRLGRGRVVFALQQGIVRKHLRDLGLKVERRQLQQSYRLL